jgi:outer membrane protein TolC
MLRRETANRSLAGVVATLYVLSVSRAAVAAEATTITAPITPSPGAQAPGGPGLKFADAIQLALTRNERARISDLNVVVANAAVEKARTGFLPVLTFNGNDTQTALVATGQPHNVATGNLVLTQPIINASAYPLYAQARALAEAQYAQSIDDKRLLSFNAASGFFAVLSASAVVNAAARQLENAQANVADTQARAEAQLTSSNDVTRAKVDQAGSARELESDKGALANAYIQLGFLLNASVSGPLVSPDATLAAAQAPPGSPDALVKFAVERRPDVLAEKQQVIAAHHFAN